ncbi:MAG: ApaG domain [Flavobacteriales bacterium]|nr:ApaG domain [Flavobacteriales bacterium]
MTTAVTNGIRVSVRVRFASEHSDAKQRSLLCSHATHHHRERGRRTVQLMRRHCNLWDSLATTRQVEGPGVVGETGVLAPGERFTRHSGQCDHEQRIGTHGRHLQRARSGHQYAVFKWKYPRSF